MSVKILAIILLLVNLVTVGFLIAVMAKQIKLIRLKIHSLQPQRITFLALSLTSFIGQLAPLALLLNAVLMDGTASTRQPSVLGMSYAVSNGITSLVLSILLWILYYRPHKGLKYTPE